MFITADTIHDGRNWLPTGSIIEAGADGTILAVHAAGSVEGATHYPGVICPGFVNAHCHLELSHLLGVIPEHTGLMEFLKRVVTRREGFTEDHKLEARHAAYRQLLDNGVVAVGDISNSSDTLDIRGLDQLHIHTFVECLGFTRQMAQQRFDYSKNVYDKFAAQLAGDKMLKQSIVPHAPYSVSEEVFRLIDAHMPGAVMSVHNQETDDENEYYLSKAGGIRGFLAVLGVDDSFFEATGKSSLQSYLQWLSGSRPLLLVHNTRAAGSDVAAARTYGNSVFWCLCPNANLYIENTLPDVPMFVREGVDLCIGTDSLSSNHRLSVLEELQTLHRHFPAIGWDELLRWATWNGARALQMDGVIGSIEPGKKPGLLCLKDYSEVTRII